MNDEHDDGLADGEFLPGEVLERWSIPEMPSDLKERVMMQVQETWSPIERRGPMRSLAQGRYNTALAVGSVAAAAAALVLSLRRPDAPPPTPQAAPAPVVAPAVVAAAEAPRGARGHLTLDVMPHDAAVDLDGVPLSGPSPFVATNLSPGRHTLRVHRDGFTDWSRSIDVPEGQLHVPVQLVAQGDAPPTAPRKPKSLARVESTAAVVEGELDRDEIREVVRTHIDEISACYNAALVRDPTLEGKVILTFVIGAKGAVREAEVASSTVDDPTVGPCMVAAVKGWTFPAPRGGGNVSVTYPFVLEVGD